MSDDIPPTGHKGAASHGGGSPPARIAWFLGVALLGFGATSAVVWLGPKAVESIKELRWPSFEVARKPGQTSRWKSPVQAQFERAVKAVNSPLPINQPGSGPPIKVGPTISIPAPNTSGGIRSGGFRVRP